MNEEKSVTELKYEVASTRDENQIVTRRIQVIKNDKDEIVDKNYELEYKNE